MKNAERIGIIISSIILVCLISALIVLILFRKNIIKLPFISKHNNSNESNENEENKLNKLIEQNIIEGGLFPNNEELNENDELRMPIHILIVEKSANVYNNEDENEFIDSQNLTANGEPKVVEESSKSYDVEDKVENSSNSSNKLNELNENDKQNTNKTDKFDKTDNTNKSNNPFSQSNETNLNNTAKLNKSTEQSNNQTNNISLTHTANINDNYIQYLLDDAIIIDNTKTFTKNNVNTINPTTPTDTSNLTYSTNLTNSTDLNDDSIF